jgi:hypothetical protein
MDWWLATHKKIARLKVFVYFQHFCPFDSWYSGRICESTIKVAALKNRERGKRAAF